MLKNLRVEQQQQQQQHDSREKVSVVQYVFSFTVNLKLVEREREKKIIIMLDSILKQAPVVCVCVRVGAIENWKKRKRGWLVPFGTCPQRSLAFTLSLSHYKFYHH